MINILLVDDENLEREAFKKILATIDLETEVVGEAQDGKEAIRLAKELNPDIIFIDTIMPRLDGMEAAQAIKRDNSNVFIYLMFSWLDHAPSFRNSQLNGTINKPIRKKDIQSILSAYTANYEEKIFTEGGLLERFLIAIHLEQYRESRVLLSELVQQLLKANQDKNQIERAVEIVRDEMIAVGEAKELPISRVNEKRDGKITYYNVGPFLDSLLRDIFQAILDNQSVTSSNEINMILNYIEMHYKEGVSLEEVAEFIHLSPNYVSRLFKKEVQTTFVNYVTDRKIEHAKYLLKNTSQPVVNIAMELSFQEHTYFSKVFKKLVGQSPTEYRNQYGKKESIASNYFNKKTIKNWYI
ncbi:helix-turn-helix domain-containing protein [Ralstonia pickettii]|nr:helix-turn-helix domain-containing protein [Ralstonia pickettii]